MRLHRLQPVPLQPQQVAPHVANTATRKEEPNAALPVSRTAVPTACSGGGVAEEGEEGTWDDD